MTTTEKNKFADNTFTIGAGKDGLDIWIRIHDEVTLKTVKDPNLRLLSPRKIHSYTRADNFTVNV